tara:strand:+ start:108 stop:593 length:486 start_codon:yes stop_codon:yes gene_type:complete
MYCDAIIDTSTDYIDGPTIRKSRKTVRFAEDTKSAEFSLPRIVEEIIYCITRKGGFDIIKEILLLRSNNKCFDELAFWKKIITFDNQDDILKAVDFWLKIITFDNRDDILESFIDLYNRYQETSSDKISVMPHGGGRGVLIQKHEYYDELIPKIIDLIKGK